MLFLRGGASIGSRARDDGCEGHCSIHHTKYNHASNLGKRVQGAAPGGVWGVPKFPFSRKSCLNVLKGPDVPVNLAFCPGSFIIKRHGFLTLARYRGYPIKGLSLLPLQPISVY